jgi:hypothetical protein
MAKLRFSSIQSGVVLFWAIWLTAVTTTNVFDAMKRVGALPRASRWCRTISS